MGNSSAMHWPSTMAQNLQSAKFRNAKGMCESYGFIVVELNCDAATGLFENLVNEFRRKLFECGWLLAMINKYYELHSLKQIKWIKNVFTVTIN